MLISLSEGSTNTQITTTNQLTGDGHTTHIMGVRDPLTVEYGINNKWGIGLNLGGDILKMDPSKLYSGAAPGKSVAMIMSEFTLDVQYHFLVTRHVDLAGFLSGGGAGVLIQGNEGDHAYKYQAGGGIMRTGIKAKYYFCRRFGFMTMLVFSLFISTLGM